VANEAEKALEQKRSSFVKTPDAGHLGAGNSEQRRERRIKESVVTQWGEIDAEGILGRKKKGRISSFV